MFKVSKEQLNEFIKHNYPDGRDRDRYVDKELKKQGYKVFRFWEHAINKDVKKCINMINI